MEIQFTKDFELAYQQMEETKNSLFITGKAGTGKSTLLRYFKEHTKKKTVYLAPTGLAAVNIGGQTIHSFFKFPPRPFDLSYIKKRKSKIYQKLQTIVIDEVSMVRADLLDAIDYFLRKNGPDELSPFGGVQMVFIGDLFQLPPVVRSEHQELLTMQGYQTPYFFSAHCLISVRLLHLELTEIFRQKDKYFLQLLNQIRNNDLTEETLQEMNKCTQNTVANFENKPYITLCSTNAGAWQINQRALSEISKPKYIFSGKLEGNFTEKNLPAPLTLHFKEGAQVMFCKNDLEGRWVNGTIGKISKLDFEKVEVEVKTPKGSEKYELAKETWELYRFTFNQKKNRIEAEVVGSFLQYPLRLAWAITIHKSQGMTFERVVIDLGRGAFAPGQVYVALSRCVSLEGLILKQKIRAKDIFMDKNVVDYAFQNNFS